MLCTANAKYYRRNIKMGTFKLPTVTDSVDSGFTYGFNWKGLLSLFGENSIIKFLVELILTLA